MNTELQSTKAEPMPMYRVNPKSAEVLILSMDGLTELYETGILTKTAFIKLAITLLKPGGIRSVERLAERINENLMWKRPVTIKEIAHVLVDLHEPRTEEGECTIQLELEIKI